MCKYTHIYAYVLNKIKVLSIDLLRKKIKFEQIKLIYNFFLFFYDIFFKNEQHIYDKKRNIFNYVY